MPGVTTAYQTGVHGSRPAASAGCILYSCTTHGLVYRSDGSAWATWATLGTSGAIIDPTSARGDMLVRNNAGAIIALPIGAANTLLHGSATDPSYSKVVPADLDVSADNTTADATTGHHGLLPKLGGGTTNFLRADGTYAAPPGGSGGYPLDSYTLDGTYGDHYTAAAISGLWTRRGYTSGAETYQLGKDATFMRVAVTGRAAGDGYLQPSSADGTYACKLIYRNYLNNYPSFGIALVDTNGTGVAIAHYSNPSGVLLETLTTYSSYGGSFHQVSSPGSDSHTLVVASTVERPVWYYIRKSGSSCYGAVSFDGEIWSPESTAVTWSGTMNRVGLLHAGLGSVNGSSVDAYIDLDWFNKIA